MRNKRLIIAVSLLIVMIVSICAFAGCKPEEEVSPAQVLMSFYNGDTKPTVNSVELTNLKDYNIVNVYDNVLVARKIDDAGVTYALFNIAENKIIATSENNFNQVIDGVYKSSKTVDGQIVYAFYDENGTLKDSVKQNECYEQSGKLYFTDGYVIVPTSNGVKIFEQTIDDINFAYFDNDHDFEVIESGELNIAISDDSDKFLVFDSNNKFIYSSRFSYILKSTEKNFNFVNLGNGKASIQVFKELTEVEARRVDAYDFIDETGNYIALTTYIYDFANKTLTEIEFNKAIEGAISTAKDEKYTLLSVYEISSAMRLSNASLIVTDNDLNVVVQLNDLVDDANGFAVIDESTYAIADIMNVHVYNEKGEKIKSYANIAQYTGAGLLKAGNKFYNYKGEKVFELEDDMIWKDDKYTNGLIYFSKEIDGVEKIGVHNSNTGKTTYYDGDAVSMRSSAVFTVSDSDGNVTVYGIYDGKAISDKTFARATYSNYGKYTIIMATDADGNVSYFAHWLERQTY